MNCVQVWAVATVLTNNRAQLVHFSPWTFIAVPAAVLGGFSFCLLSCATRGGYRGGLARVVRSELRGFLWLALLDAIGGAFVAAGTWVSSPSRIRVVPNLSVQAPWAFWIAIGLTGPLIAYGVVWKGPFRWGFRPSESDDKRMAAIVEGERWKSLRRLIVKQIHTAMDDEVKIRQELLEDWLVRITASLVVTNRMSLDNLCARVERQFTQPMDEDDPFTDRWRERQTEWNLNPTRHVVEALIWSAIGRGEFHAVSRAVGLRVSEFDFEAAYAGRLQDLNVADISGADADKQFRIDEFEAINADPVERE